MYKLCDVAARRKKNVEAKPTIVVQTQKEAKRANKEIAVPEIQHSLNSMASILF